jgi:hypothetical protein
MAEEVGAVLEESKIPRLQDIKKDLINACASEDIKIDLRNGDLDEDEKDAINRWDRRDEEIDEIAGDIAQGAIELGNRAKNVNEHLEA